MEIGASYGIVFIPIEWEVIEGAQGLFARQAVRLMAVE